DEIDPRLRALPQDGCVRMRTFHVYGVGESHVDHRLRSLAQGEVGVTIHYQVVFPENRVKVVVRGRDASRAETKLTELEQTIRSILGHHIYGVDGDSFPAAVGRVLRERGATLAVAESCTGGLVGHLVTSVAGSSDYFTLGVVTYSNESKCQLAGVRKA